MCAGYVRVSLFRLFICLHFGVFALGFVVSRLEGTLSHDSAASC